MEGRKKRTKNAGGHRGKLEEGIFLPSLNSHLRARGSPCTWV
jgi:hypothetical protein